MYKINIVTQNKSMEKLKYKKIKEKIIKRIIKKIKVPIILVCLLVGLYLSLNFESLEITTEVFAAITDQSSTSTKKQTDQSSTNNSKDMVELLARLINGEARGEPYKGQVAVGAVVMNRVKRISRYNIWSNISKRTIFLCNRWSNKQSNR